MREKVMGSWRQLHYHESNIISMTQMKDEIVKDVLLTQEMRNIYKIFIL